MSYRCIVVDDEKPARERLKRLLAEHRDFTVVAEAADAATAVKLIDELQPDLCLLDVQMPEGDGFSVLERVRRIPGVIFTTAYDRYAVRAFEVRSLDYLLKPFSKQRLAAALDRVRTAALGAERDEPAVRDVLQEIRDDLREATSEAGVPLRVTARRGPKILLLAPSEILCFEADETLVFARTEQGRFLVERTLAELEASLGPGYFRSHRRCLINLARIVEILPGEAGTFRIVLGDEARTQAPLSRRQARRLRELIPW